MPNSPLFEVPMLEGGSDYPTPDATADSKQINDQFKYAEQFWGVKQVTSGSLPSSPKVQQLIYETDTGRLRYWNGTDWISITSLHRGPAATRDILYPAPVTDPQKVALANQLVSWFNTEKGWWESYYAPLPLSGLTAPGLATGTAAGWYPMPGFGPYLRMKVTASTSVSGVELLTTFWSIDSQFGGTDWIEFASGAGTYTVKKAGRYSIEAVISAQIGSGAIAHTINLNSTDASIGRLATMSGELLGTTEAFVTLLARQKLLAANSVLRHYNILGGPYDIGVSTGLVDYLLVKYDGPPFA